jgi:D-alanyl-D-alanine carboxypeptidase
MKKIIFSIFSLLLCLCFTIPASAYQINDYEMHHKAGMVVYLDPHHGDVVIYEENADQRIYPASITKLMSALVMVENIPDLENTKITYSEYANNQVLGTGSVVLGLKVGEQISAKDALAALLVSSCGDISYAIAEHVGGSSEGFVKMMNEKAKELAELFIKNFNKFTHNEAGKALVAAGPKI